MAKPSQTKNLYGINEVMTETREGQQDLAWSPIRFDNTDREKVPNALSLPYKYAKQIFTQQNCKNEVKFFNWGTIN